MTDTSYPVTKRTDVLPSNNTFPDSKKDQKSFDEAMNPPNNPKKDQQPESYNVTDDYCEHEHSDQY